MNIFDAHAHSGKDYFYYNVKGDKVFDFPLEKLVRLMDKNHVKKSIVSHCPSVKEITCCMPTDLIKKGNRIISQCPKCKKVVAVLNHDPYRKYNLKLIREIRAQHLESRIVPFFIIHMQNPFIKDEIDFYSRRYDKFGLKFHTFISRRSLLNIKDQLGGIKLPILVHSGHDSHSNPRNTLKFAKSYGGKILMAHCARLSSKYLAQISKISNLFVDSSPLTSFYNRILNKDFETILESRKRFSSIQNPEDIYKYLLKFCDSRKILFGTDVPWCDRFGQGYQKEIEVFNALKIDKRTKEDLAFRNFERFLS
jgi:predicted TIM-barrel fold metal-dependent hydrolase